MADARNEDGREVDHHLVVERRRGLSWNELDIVIRARHAKRNGGRVEDDD